jgi:hypothetical protein
MDLEQQVFQQRVRGMKVIIAGSRSIEDKEVVLQAIADSKFTITEVISGGAKGVDRMGEEWAEEQGIPFRVIRTGWKRGGRGGGFVNNEDMADQAEALIAVYDGESKGTKHMIDTMRKRGKKIFTKMWRPQAE